MARKKWVVIPGGRIKRWKSESVGGAGSPIESRRTGTEIT